MRRLAGVNDFGKSSSDFCFIGRVAGGLSTKDGRIVKIEDF
jgi:hypothetical protein